MNKKSNKSSLPELHPRIIEIEDKEIEEKKPPIKNIIYYKLINEKVSSKPEKEKL